MFLFPDLLPEAHQGICISLLYVPDPVLSPEGMLIKWHGPRGVSRLGGRDGHVTDDDDDDDDDKYNNKLNYFPLFQFHQFASGRIDERGINSGWEMVGNIIYIYKFFSQKKAI